MSTVTDDGNFNIHPTAVSSFLAAESKLSADAHVLALKTLAPRFVGEKRTWEGTLCVVDGAPVLTDALQSHLPGVTITRCRNHFRDSPLLLTKNGRRDIPAYEKLISVPQGQKAVAERIWNALPDDSPIRDYPKEQLCDAYLPDNVQSNGVRLNNHAEQWNAMSAKTSRREPSLFRSMVADEELLRLRQQFLFEKCMNEKKKVMPLNTRADDLVNAPWPSKACTPNVELEVHRERERAQQLKEPDLLPGSTETAPMLKVCSSAINSKTKYTVKPAEVRQGNFLSACGCGLVASSKVTCKHYQKALQAERWHWQHNVKPWQKPEAWQQACQPIPPPPDYDEMANEVILLSNAGKLRRLTQPSLDINRRGRPSDSTNAQNDKRIKRFLEVCGKDDLAVEETERVLGKTTGSLPRTLPLSQDTTPFLDNITGHLSGIVFFSAQLSFAYDISGPLTFVCCFSGQ